MRDSSLTDFWFDARIYFEKHLVIFEGVDGIDDLPEILCEMSNFLFI